MTKWYYVEDGERVGPVEQEELQALVDKGDLNEESFVWKKGFENWERLSLVDELQFFFEKEIELPPMASDMPPIIAAKKKFSWEALGERDKVISIKVGIDRGEQEIEYGPYTLLQLKKAFDEQRVSEKTLVYIPGMPEWIFLGDIPHFESLFGELPPMIEEVDRRQNIRKPFVARMFFHDSKEVYEGVCRDISTGGMQVLLSDFPLKVGEEVTLNVHPDNDNYHFVATALVVRVLESDQGFSLRFIDLSTEAEGAIQSFIDVH